MEIKIRDEFIKLGQALKLAGVVEDGVEAKYAMKLTSEEAVRFMKVM